MNHRVHRDLITKKFVVESLPVEIHKNRVFAEIRLNTGEIMHSRLRGRGWNHVSIKAPERSRCACPHIEGCEKSIPRTKGVPTDNNSIRPPTKVSRPEIRTGLKPTRSQDDSPSRNFNRSTPLTRNHTVNSPIGASSNSVQSRTR
jgi:hypothetical protein